MGTWIVFDVTVFSSFVASSLRADAVFELKAASSWRFFATTFLCFSSESTFTRLPDDPALEVSGFDVFDDGVVVVGFGAGVVTTLSSSDTFMYFAGTFDGVLFFRFRRDFSVDGADGPASDSSGERPVKFCHDGCRGSITGSAGKAGIPANAVSDTAVIEIGAGCRPSCAAWSSSFEMSSNQRGML